jgi:hypothetical protein
MTGIARGSEDRHMTDLTGRLTSLATVSSRALAVSQGCADYRRASSSGEENG